MGLTHAKAMRNYLSFLYLENYERYKVLQKMFGEEVLRKITVKQTASFMGIFPESLARIRKQIRESNV